MNHEWVVIRLIVATLTLLGVPVRGAFRRKRDRSSSPLRLNINSFRRDLASGSGSLSVAVALNALILQLVVGAPPNDFTHCTCRVRAENGALRWLETNSHQSVPQARRAFVVQQTRSLTLDGSRQSVEPTWGDSIDSLVTYALGNVRVQGVTIGSRETQFGFSYAIPIGVKPFGEALLPTPIGETLSARARVIHQRLLEPST